MTARKNEWPLDKLAIVADVTKKAPDEIEGATREGAYVHGARRGRARSRARRAAAASRGELLTGARARCAAIGPIPAGTRAGLYIEGARWDMTASVLEESFMKDLYPLLPVVLIRAATQDKLDGREIYACPVYKTASRGPTYVFTAGLRTKAPPSKWILAGVALLMDVVT